MNNKDKKTQPSSRFSLLGLIVLGCGLVVLFGYHSIFDFIRDMNQTAALSGPGSGLVSYWKLDEGTGSSISDSSGYGNGGTVTGSPLWSTGHSGTALELSGSTQYASVPYNALYDFNQSGGFTVSAWIKLTSGVSSLRFVLTQGYGERGWYLAIDENNKLKAAYNSPSYGTLSGSSALSSDVWHHVALSYAPSAIKLYVDGQAIATDSTTTQMPAINTAGPFLIGNRWSNGFAGSIDEVRVYNRALSLSEVGEIFVFDQSSGDSDEKVIHPQTPLVSAGGDYMTVYLTHLPESILLMGSITNQNTTHTVIPIEWSMTSGPSSVSFEDVSKAQTKVLFTTAGQYLLKITANYSGVTISDDILIIVKLRSDNQSPILSLPKDYSLLHNYVVPQVESINATSTTNNTSIPTDTTSSAALHTPLISRVLVPGASHSDVLVLKKFLIEQGLLQKDFFSTIQTYDAATQRAVEEYQKQNNLVLQGSPYTTGFGAVGPKTRERINELITAKTATNSDTAISNILPSLQASSSRSFLETISSLLLKLNLYPQKGTAPK